MAVWPLGPAARHVSEFVWVNTALGPGGRGPLSTVKLVEEDAVPTWVVTAIGPVVAPAGTVAVILVELLTVNEAGVPWKATERTPTKFVPLIVTRVPTGPEVGENDVIVGAPGPATTLNAFTLAAVPTWVVTAIGPVVAPTGTVAMIWVGPSTVQKAAVVPPKVTEVAPNKFVPVIVTEVPAGPEVGLNEVMVGAHAPAPNVERKVPVLVDVPAGFAIRML